MCERLRDIFRADVTRDIPPVVYFHEQSPEKVATEVSEYIVTGGWPAGHPNHQRVPNGIHEQYVGLISAISREIEAGDSKLPCAWISWFFGSGKSSFAKLLGLSLDGLVLPGGVSLANAFLQRNTSPRAAEMRDAWDRLRSRIKPLAVVFDVGSVANEGEHVYGAAVRQLQKRLGYCEEPNVAHYELKLERDGQWQRFTETFERTVGAKWADQCHKAFAEDEFSAAMSAMFPTLYPEPMTWYSSRAGLAVAPSSPTEAVKAIADMVHLRQPDATVFFVIDEVSQYVITHMDRVERLRAFAEQLGAQLRGKVWLLALGQQKLEETASEAFLVKMKDRFPPQMRVHLSPSNIRDVVHKRLLEKKPECAGKLREMFATHRTALQLYAYGCESITADDFVDCYPLLPGYIDRILEITSALRARSSRAQGDDQAIRGLLQLLGELFRTQQLADLPYGTLITLDRIYDVQSTALESDVQQSMARVLNHCADDPTGLKARAAKAVALLQVIQETEPTTAKLVAQFLYDRLGADNNLTAVTEALESLRSANLLGYAESTGYRIQSTSGEEWERERRDVPVGTEKISERVREALKYLLEIPPKATLQSRPFPYVGLYSARGESDVKIVDSRDDAFVTIDCRFVPADERVESTWVPKSAESGNSNRIIWVCGDRQRIEEIAREYCRSQGMVRRYLPSKESLTPTKKILLQEEENRSEDLQKKLRDEVAATWMGGRMYFRGQGMDATGQGTTFGQAVQSVAAAKLPSIFPSFIATQVAPTELRQLLEENLVGISPTFMPEHLGILELDTGRYVPSCGGAAPRSIGDYIKAESSLSGATLISTFGGPPYAYTPNLVKACIAGLLRAGRIKITPEGGPPITAVRDVGTRDVFEGDAAFKKATFTPAGTDDVGLPARARICAFFRDTFNVEVERDNPAIADAVGAHFPTLAATLRSVQDRLNQLPESPRGPEAFVKLQEALEASLRNVRQTEVTVQTVKRHLDALSDGAKLAKEYDTELTDQAITYVKVAHAARERRSPQLVDIGFSATNVETAAARITTQLASATPWRAIETIDDAVADVQNAYESERTRLLEKQQEEAEAARLRLSQRRDFGTLNSDDQHKVMRPITEALSDTTPSAIAPPLIDLRDGFRRRLQAAEDRGNELLDQILGAGSGGGSGGGPFVIPVDLRLRNREIGSEAEVDALCEEIRTRLLEHVEPGTRVRIL